MDQYRYDIAFSFLARDEPIARDLYNRLKTRYNIFMYSEQQKELAGKDGESAFKKVFETESRLVVVLYRPEWGSTPWTRMEETGIRDRAYNFGYGFTTFVALTEVPQMPDWFPKQRLYVGYARFGLDIVVAVIDARAQEAEIPSRELSLLERAHALEKTRKFEAERERYLHSFEAVESAKQLERELRSLLKQRFEELSDALPSLHIQDASNGIQFAITGAGPALLVEYDQGYSNNVRDAELCVALYKGSPPIRGVMYFGEPERIARINLAIDRTESLPLCWRCEGKNYSNKEAVDLIADFWLKRQPEGRKASHSPFSRVRR